MENEIKRNPVKKEEIDRLSLLIFGERRLKGIDKEGEDAQKFPNLKEPSNKSTRGPDWLWGYRRKEPAKGIDKEKENTQKFPNLEEPSNKSKRGQDWLWGYRRKEPANQINDTQNSIETFLNGIDQELLFETIDTVVSLTEQIKPLLKEYKPLLIQLIKKFKSK